MFIDNSQQTKDDLSPIYMHQYRSGNEERAELFLIVYVFVGIVTPERTTPSVANGDYYRLKTVCRFLLNLFFKILFFLKEQTFSQKCSIWYKYD